MVGTILNGAAIVLGGIFGLASKKQLSLAHQTALKILLGAFTVYAGLSATWKGLSGSFPQILKQLGIVVLALTLGNLLGKLLRIQKGMNHLGQYARQKISIARPENPQRINDGFVTGSILFCVAPLAYLGSLQDGLTGDFKALAVKAVMDGLATMAFVTTFGWGITLSVVPVLACQGTLTLLATLLRPGLENHALLGSVQATNGLLIFCVSLIIFELKKIHLADYLPSLAVAPLLTWLLR